MNGVDAFFSKEDLYSLVCRETASIFNVSFSGMYSLDNKNLSFKELASFESSTTNTKNKDALKAEDVMNFWASIVDKEFKDSKIIFFDLQNDKILPKKIKKIYSESELYSCVGIKINVTEDKYNVLVLVDNQKLRKWTDEDFEFINVISRNLSVAIKQYTLFNDLCNRVSMESKLLDSLPFPLWIVDNNHKILSVNIAFREYFNIKNKESIIGISERDVKLEKSNKKVDISSIKTKSYSLFGRNGEHTGFIKYKNNQ